MKKLLLSLLVSFAVIQIPLANINGQPVSDFNDDTLQGWTKFLPFNGDLWNPTNGGNPGGFMKCKDTQRGGGPLHVAAPIAFTGDLTTYSGIQWDEYKYNCDPSYGSPTHPFLIGTDGTIYRESVLPEGPLEVWYTRTVPFDPNVWIRITGTSSFQQVLQNISAIHMKWRSTGIVIVLMNRDSVLMRARIPQY